MDIKNLQETFVIICLHYGVDGAIVNQSIYPVADLTKDEAKAWLLDNKKGLFETFDKKAKEHDMKTVFVELNDEGTSLLLAIECEGVLHPSIQYNIVPINIVRG